jgi:hypothetical protein
MRFKFQDEHYWLRRAQEARSGAEAGHATDAKHDMLRIAEVYERLAEHYGQTAKKKAFKD